MANRCRKNSNLNEHYTLSVIGLNNRYVCHYCGCPADTTDHIPPIARFHDAIALCGYFKPIKVPCCRECNGLASSELHTCFIERQQYIRSKLSIKYLKQLRIVEWSDDELSEMSYAFKTSIRKDIAAKRFVENRLSFFPV